MSGVTNFAELPSVPSDRPVPFTDQLQLAVAAYLLLIPSEASGQPLDRPPWLLPVMNAGLRCARRPGDA